MSIAWPASFHLLPTDPPYYSPDGSPIPIDLYDVSSWDTWGLSPLAAGINEAGSSASAQMRPAAQRAASVASVGMTPARSMSGGSELREMAQLSLAAEAVGAGEGQTTEGAPSTLPFPASASASRRGTGAPPPPPGLSSEPQTRSVSETEKRARRASDKVEEYLKAKGPFHPVNASPQIIRSHLARVLSAAQQFRRDILEGYSEEKARKGMYPPTVVVASRGTETISGSMVSEGTPEALAREAHEKLIFEWGDGVVTWDSATHVPGKWGRHVVKGAPPSLRFLPSSR